MGRLTEPNHTYHDCDFMESGMAPYMNRLAAYEDTGLTPEMVLRLIEEYGRLAIECEFYKTQDHAWDFDWYKRAEEDETYPLKEDNMGTMGKVV